jgi:hypothetical protein
VKLVTSAAWLEGLMGTGVIVIESIIGLFSLYKAWKMKAKLLYFAGFLIIFTGLLYLGPLTDFLLVVFTGKNLDPRLIYPILSYMWIAPAVFFAMYIGGELMLPSKKWWIVGIFVALGVIFEIFLWGFTADSFTFATIGPGDMIDTSFNESHPTFILIAIFIIATLFFNGIGFLIKGYQSTGVLRKKFLYLSIGFIIFDISGVFDALTPAGIVIGLIIARIRMMVYSVLVYLGLKT